MDGDHTTALMFMAHVGDTAGIGCVLDELPEGVKLIDEPAHEAARAGRAGALSVLLAHTPCERPLSLVGEAANGGDRECVRMALDVLRAHPECYAAAGDALMRCAREVAAAGLWDAADELRAEAQKIRDGV